MESAAATPALASAVSSRTDFEDRFADLLLEHESLTAPELREARLRQKSQSQSLPQTLVDLGSVDAGTVLALASEILGVPSIDLASTPGDASVLETVPRSLAYELGVIPLFAVGGELTVATSEPYDLAALDSLRFATGMEVLPVFALDGDLSKHLAAYYGEHDPQFDPFAIEYEADDDEDGLALDDLEIEAQQPTVRLVNLIFASCIAEGASDIHFEPGTGAMSVRSRVDGIMRAKPYEIPREAESGVVVRLKVLAKLDISERRRPQDGKIRARLQGRRIDIRVSTFPTIHGEKVVLRILDKERSDFRISNIGMAPTVQEGWLQLLKGQEGILLVTGPTGSGKSSTLYASLRHIRSPQVNIVTLEDPVEYELDGITQGQVHRQAGFTFASGLRAILRQDPDIILVGEIRDAETAEIAARAALTGHLVLATLHTNSAAAAVTRLTDIGLDPYLVASSLRGVLAQRLIRRVCSECALERPLDEAERQEIGEWFDLEELVTAGVGCTHCRDSGYSGRTGLHELLVIDSETRRLIAQSVPESAIASAAAERGLASLWQDGLEKVRAGVTTPSELLRVAPRHERCPK